MSADKFYALTSQGDSVRQVEAWSSYPIQFDGQRRYHWQEEMVAELRAALATIGVGPGEVLAGTYRSTDVSRCDTENRLFTNPGSGCFPKGVTWIRFERGASPPPLPPSPLTAVDGHLYYRYRAAADWQWWEPAHVLARWRRIPRQLPDDGSARPVWLAMKQAAVAA